MTNNTNTGNKTESVDSGSIYVTKPAMPPFDEYLPYLSSLWESRELTNGGRYHAEFEQKLCQYLGCQHISLFTNGTIALITALKALGLKGEVITTPYSFVATSSALLWAGLTPVFVDVDPDSFNLASNKIEAAITPRTSAILAVHCYGTPCDVSAIQEIADRHGLKVIYDAAHAFAVEDGEGSILRHGDLSIVSFHATKVFHTFEGGAVVAKSASYKEKIDKLKNFGVSNEVVINDLGLNGKMSELNAAFGVLQLKYVDKQIEKRRTNYAYYMSALCRVCGIKLFPISALKGNYSYFPILIEDQFWCDRDALYEKLMNNGIYPRRYFYPLLPELGAFERYSSNCAEELPVAYSLANRVLCLPLYSDLDKKDIERICQIIKGVVGESPAC